jgi:hypothetical protein
MRGFDSAGDLTRPEPEGRWLRALPPHALGLEDPAIALDIGENTLPRSTWRDGLAF